MGKVCTVILSTGLVVGIIVAILGGVMFPVFNIIIHNEIVKQTKLTNGTMGFEQWSNPSADIFMQFWVWNLTNPEEVQSGKKPYLVERGPYTYREEMIKKEIEPHNNATLSYVQEKSYILDLDRSVGDPRNETFISVNIPLLTVAGMLDHMNLPGFIKDLLEGLLVTQKVFPTHTVHDIIWGYPDDLMKLAYQFKLAPYPDFGIFVDRNNSNDGVYTVYSGVNEVNTDKINDITRWRGEPELPYWSTEEANMINGSDGSYNPPFFNKDKMMYVFSSDICRSISAVYEKENSVRDVPTWRYVGPPQAFANATEYPPNVGFCTPDASHCLPSGMLNVSNCQFGAPIVMSLPHFLYCDKEQVIDLVNGVKPNKEEHQTFFDIEPMTGGPLNVAKRLQINAYLQPFPKVPGLASVNTLFLPVIWLNESAYLTQSGADQLISQVETPILLTTVAKWGCLGLGLLIVIITAAALTMMWIMRSPARDRRHQPGQPGVQTIGNQSGGDTLPVNPNTHKAQSESSPLLA